jgi:hypothetical protein
MIEAVRTSETSVNFNATTRPYISEDSKTSISKRFIETFQFVWWTFKRNNYKEMLFLIPCELLCNQDHLSK